MHTRGFLMGLLWLFTQTAMAQTPEQGAQRVAQQLCHCINEQHQDLDPKVKMALSQLLRYQLDEQPEQMTRYLNRLSESTRKSINEQLQRLKERGPLTRQCLSRMEATMRTLDTSHPKYETLTEAQFNQLILEALEQEADGNLASVLWETGLRFQRMRQPDQQVNTGAVRNH